MENKSALNKWTNPPQESSWISAEERLPETNDEYLITDADYAVSTADFRADTKEWFTVRSYGQDCDERPLYCITHWMPLPAPPEAELRESTSPPLESAKCPTCGADEKRFHPAILRRERCTDSWHEIRDASHRTQESADPLLELANLRRGEFLGHAMQYLTNRVPRDADAVEILNNAWGKCFRDWAELRQSEAPQQPSQEVYSRPECPFNYCDTKAPHTECLKGCHHAT